jgi:hypothetical protein
LVLADPDGPRLLGDALFAISGAMITSRKVCPHLCDGFGERPGELSQASFEVDNRGRGARQVTASADHHVRRVHDVGNGSRAFGGVVVGRQEELACYPGLDGS